VVSNGDAPLVAVFVGTDHHRFDRLLDWVSRLEARGTYRVVVQHGYTPLPQGLTGQSMLGPAEMADLLRRADAVVTHAGPGSIMDAREHGHVPVVVPRSPRWHEHVDDHQERFARRLAPSGGILIASTSTELEAQLRVAITLVRRGATLTQPTPALARFESLVEELVRR